MSNGGRQHKPPGSSGREPPKGPDDPKYVPSAEGYGWTMEERMRRVREEQQSAGAQVAFKMKMWRKERERGQAAFKVDIPAQEGGAPLADDVKKKMEGQLGADLSAVKVHTGGESAKAADSLSARAFTQGNHIHFADGEYKPGTKDGDQLLGHELTHTVQQKGAPAASNVHRKEEDPGAAHGTKAGGVEVSDSSEPAEKEADHAGDRVAQNLHDTPHAGSEKDIEAEKYNLAHPDFVAQFNQLTGGQCEGPKGVDVKKVRAWQAAHDLEADGKVGKHTIAAARKGKGKTGEKGHGKGHRKAEKMSFSDKEAGDPITGSTAGPDAFEGEGVANDGPIMKNPVPLAERAVGGGQTKGQEVREGEPEGEAAKEGGEWAKEGAEKGAAAAGVGGEEGARASILEKQGREMGVEMEGEAAHGGGAAGKVGLSVAVRLTLVPHIVGLLKQHKFKEALKVVWSSVGADEKVEVVKFIVEKVGGELSEHALELFEKFALAGFVFEVLKLGWDWTYGGLKAIREAHEKGDRDSRIGIYAFAWSSTVMKGGHSNPGAITPEQIEANKLGVADGLATRKQSPELTGLLIAEYGSEDIARSALQDALYQRAGLDVGNHRGK